MNVEISAEIWRLTKIENWLVFSKDDDSCKYYY